MEKAARELLKRVSRSMYLSLAVLPAEIRDAMGLGYLLCRAADTIADTRLIPRPERLEALEDYRNAFAGGRVPAPSLLSGYARHQASRAERELLERLGECVALWERFPEEERRLLREVVFGVTDGMRMDLELFPGDTERELRALPGAGELERYCAYIGGAPGVFWTELSLLRLKGLRGADAAGLRESGFRLGQGLQITNILRDMAKDLRIGRCYLPEPELRELGLSPADLLDPGALPRLRPALARWLRWGLDRLSAGAAYVERMPALRLKAAAAWPLLLAFKTLLRVQRSAELLEPGRPVKVPRGEVYGLMAASAWTLSSNARFKRQFEKLRSELLESLAAPCA